MELVFSSAALRSVSSEIGTLLKWSRVPDVVSFAGGLPDASLFPIDEFCRISERVLRTRGYHALQYGPTPGEPDFIDALVTHMRSFGESATCDEICVTSSSHQGLDLLTLLLLDEGAPVIVELPSYIGALQSFGRAGADLRGVPLTSEGIDLTALEGALRRLEREGKRPRFIYVIPDFQNPSGINMSLETRRGLLSMARARSLLVVEDSPYRELTYSGTPLPSLWSLSGGDGVVQLKTFSKMLMPGLRLGWIVARPQLLERIILLKQSVDLCTASFNQLLVAEYLREGLMHGTLDRAVACYRPKRDRMLRSLEQHMPAGTSWSTPEGGMFLWVRLPAGLSSASLADEAGAAGVVYVNGRQFHCDGSGHDTMRLNYSFPSLEQIERGIRVLGRTVAAALEDSPRPGVRRDTAGARHPE